MGGFAVLHYDKQTDSSSGLSKHIDRGYYQEGVWVPFHPTNADASRTFMNRELIDMRDESGRTLSRDERIAKRLEESGVKVKKNSVRAVTIIMSASVEDMKRIMDEGRFDEWCDTSIEWAKRTHGVENVVAAALHMDEKTPHLHVTVVPIVHGLSKDQIYRQKKEQEAIEAGKEIKAKRKYTRKDVNALRLCAADVMGRTRLKEYQTSYAEAMATFGLRRGIDGSMAKHVDINDWYKSLVLEGQELERKNKAAKAELAKVEKELKKSTAGKMIDAIGSRKENKHLREELARKEDELARKDDEIQELKDGKLLLETSLRTEKNNSTRARKLQEEAEAQRDAAKKEADEEYTKNHIRGLLENKFETARQNLPAVLAEPLLKDLDMDDKMRLAGLETISRKSIKLAGVDYSLKDGGDIFLKWDEKENSVRISGGRLRGAKTMLQTGWMIFREWLDKCVDYLADGVKAVRGNKRENESAEQSLQQSGSMKL